MKERFEQLMELLHMNPTQFASAIGIQRATIQHILSGRNEPSLKIVMAIHERFPDVELDWLLYGKGQAIPGLQPDNAQDSPDYPLLPGFEAMMSADSPETSNLRDVETRYKPRKRHENKTVTSPQEAPETVDGKSIKKIVIFFEDGTYQEFSSNLKK